MDENKASNIPQEYEMINNLKFNKMGVLKVIEVLSSSEKSWEDAAKSAVKNAAKSLKGIRSVNVSNMSAVVKDNEITEFRLNVKIAFEVQD